MKIGDLVKDDRGEIGIVVNVGFIFPRLNGRTIQVEGCEVRFDKAFHHSNNLFPKHTKWYQLGQLEAL